MRKLQLFVASIICIARCLAAAQPAPAEKGLVVEEGNSQTKDAEKNESKSSEKEASENVGDDKTLPQQIADLKAEIQNLTAMLEKIGDPKKDLGSLETKLANLEAENTLLGDRVKTLERDKDKLSERIQQLEGKNATLEERLAKMEKDGPVERTAAKPTFVKSAVRFFNHEGHPVKMNVNGVWHTAKAGENTIWVPYGPVHIYRYTGAEPRMFSTWQPHADGFVMDFDIGTPPKE